LSREFLNPELSLLAFQRRVLALADDPRTPLRERLRFLGIVTSNLDELYMVRMAELRLAALDRQIARMTDHGDGLSAQDRLHAVEEDITRILAAQTRCATACLADARAHGVALLPWRELTAPEQRALHRFYLDEIQPVLSPMDITLSPGVPLPHLPHLGLFVAVVYRAPGSARVHVAEHEVPPDIPRLLPVRGRMGAVILLEEVLRANVHTLYPHTGVDGAYLFRVTRGGDLHLHEDHAADLLGAVADATARRPQNPAVRVEVEAQMPEVVRTRLLDNLRRDALGRDMTTTVSAVQPVEGVLDLRCLQALPLPDDPALEYAPLVERADAAAGDAMTTAIQRADVLMHHPFEAFDGSVVRFFTEAATDPDVTAIGATLYRVGNPSPIVDALLVAARAGKRVFVFVELQARFDEAHNVQWARALERAGGQVVYGLPGLKVHAKLALVTRQRQGRTERYVHIGTGNYNPRTGRQYTDLSLFSCDDALADDVATVLAALAASTAPTVQTSSGLLVAPHSLLTGLLQRIEREADHARAGRPASITIKVNGLADREVVRALYAASQAGVTIDLIVRGICTLRAGVPGLSDRIRVISVVGRWLEHSRIYRFANGGMAEYLIGSADLRPRNLRRRVEVLVPVRAAPHRARLDAILDAYLADGTAWELRGDGTSEQRAGTTPEAQRRFAQGTPD
jgi:polyphosphate kinase